MTRPAGNARPPIDNVMAGPVPATHDFDRRESPAPRQDTAP
jgi:hypothetical protein